QHRRDRLRPRQRGAGDGPLPAVGRPGAVARPGAPRPRAAPRRAGASVSRAGRSAMSLTTLFAVVLLPVLLGLTGLVADGGEVLVARRQVQGLAESAAHAGAAQLDTAAARANPDGPAPLDPRAAELAAAQYIAIQE